MRIPYLDLKAQHRALKPRLLEAAARVLEHGQFILGPEVAELERRLAALFEAPHAVGVASGTAALVLALRLRGVGPGDEVITTSHSFVATASAVALTGARPVFVDIDPLTMLLDPARLTAALSPRTRAVIPVHLNGFPCDVPAIEAFCREHGLALIEDCAQAIGARLDGRPLGRSGLGCLSLHPLKALGACGDAGAIIVQRDEDAHELRRLRNLGLTDRDHCAAISGNCRLDTLQAALLLVKLEQLDSWLARRRAHAAAYGAALVGRLRFQRLVPGAEPSHSVVVAAHPRRDDLLAWLRGRGIEAKVHYPLAIHQQRPFCDDGPWALPQTERTVAEIFSLPATPELSDKDRDEVVAALLEIL